MRLFRELLVCAIVYISLATSTTSSSSSNGQAGETPTEPIFVPDEYKLSLSLNPKQDHFFGKVVITGHVEGGDLELLSFDRSDLVRIDRVGVNIYGPTDNKNNSDDNDYDNTVIEEKVELRSAEMREKKLSIGFEHEVKEGRTLQVTINFCSQFGDARGVIRSSDGDQLYTRMYPEYAYPCVPGHKAYFQLKVLVPVDMTAVSSACLINQEEIIDGAYKKISFYRTHNKLFPDEFGWFVGSMKAEDDDVDLTIKTATVKSMIPKQQGQRQRKVKVVAKKDKTAANTKQLADSMVTFLKDNLLGPLPNNINGPSDIDIVEVNGGLGEWSRAKGLLFVPRFEMVNMEEPCVVTDPRPALVKSLPVGNLKKEKTEEGYLSSSALSDNLNSLIQASPTNLTGRQMFMVKMGRMLAEQWFPLSQINSSDQSGFDKDLIAAVGWFAALSAVDHLQLPDWPSVWAMFRLDTFDRIVSIGSGN